MSLMGLLLDRRFESTGSVSISQNPSTSLIEALGGSPSPAGVTVTEATAHGLPVVFSCDKVIKQDIAKTPIKLKRRLKDGSRVDDPNHPVYVALHDMPNRAMTPYEFKETMQGYLNLWGNAYAEIVRHVSSVNGLQIELWPLDAARMTVDVDGLSRLRYSYRMPNGSPKVWIYDPANPPIFHLRQNSLDGIHGRGPIRVLRDQHAISLARQSYQARFYGQGGHPRVALSTSQTLSGDAAKRIRTDFETLTVGEGNWHRVLVLDHDLKPVPLVMPHKDAEFVEQLKLSRSEIAGAFRVYGQKINDLERATFSNITELNIAHVGDTLMPHFVCWTEAIARDLLTAKSFNTHFAKFVVDALMRGDPDKLNTALQLQRQNGVITANQWRRVVDMDDQISEADGGDLYLVNGNMVPMHRDPAAMLELPPPQGPVN